MRYEFIRDQAVQYPVSLLCQVLQVTRSGYYAWRRGPESARAQEDRRLLVKIQTSHTTSKQTYGSPRIHAHLCQQGETCGRHRVARIMRAAGVVAKHRRKFRATTNSAHQFPVADNILDRQFTPTAPNQAWERHHLRAHAGRLALSGHCPGPGLPADCRLGDVRAD